jgi:hypothetical protein
LDHADHRDVYAGSRARHLFVTVRDTPGVTGTAQRMFQRFAVRDLLHVYAGHDVRFLRQRGRRALYGYFKTLVVRDFLVYASHFTAFQNYDIW